MSLFWIKISPELQEAIKIINSIDINKFTKLLNHIMENSTTKTKNEIFTSEEKTSLERVFKLNSDQVILLIKYTLHILERMTKFMMRPSYYMHDLKNILHMNPDKCESFISKWKLYLKNVAEDYNIKNFGEISHLSDVKWQLNMAVSSHLNKKEKLTTVLLNLKSSHDCRVSENLFLELTIDELLNFNNQLETVQLELDTVLGSQYKQKNN